MCDHGAMGFLARVIGRQVGQSVQIEMVQRFEIVRSGSDLGIGLSEKPEECF